MDRTNQLFHNALINMKTHLLSWTFFHWHGDINCSSNAYGILVCSPIHNPCLQLSHNRFIEHVRTLTLMLHIPLHIFQWHLLKVAAAQQSNGSYPQGETMVYARMEQFQWHLIFQFHPRGYLSLPAANMAQLELTA